MNKGFLSPKIAKKAAATPRVDVNELAARMTRLKNGEVENTDVSQPRQATRVVNTKSSKHSEGDSDRGTNEGVGNVVATHQEEPVPIDVDGTFVQSDRVDTHASYSTMEQVKPISLGATDSNESIGVKGAELVNKANVMVDLNPSVQPSATDQSNSNVEQLIAKANKNFDDAMLKLDRDIANMESSSLGSLGGSSGTNVKSTNVSTSSFSEALKTQQFGTNVEKGSKASGDRSNVVGSNVTGSNTVGDSSNVAGSHSNDNMSVPTEPQDDGLDSRDHWKRVMQGHAGANLVRLVASNRIAKEVIETEHGKSAITFYGNSFIAGSDEACSECCTSSI